MGHSRTAVRKRGWVIVTSLQAATTLVFAYLCLCEFMPVEVLRLSYSEKNTQEVILLAALSFLTVLVASTNAGSARWLLGGSGGGRQSAADLLLTGLNIVPVAVAVAATFWRPGSDNCPAPPFDQADTSVGCDDLAVGLDTVGLITARLARFNLGLSLLLATRGKSGWLARATGGWLGLPEAVPLHRAAGWWCAGHSAVHSVAYISFYPWTGGLTSLWRNVFPVSLPPPGGMNTLGLVNFFGLLAFVALMMLAITALPFVRARYYHVFQRLHLPFAVLFVICCALHDLPILLFSVPGIADWYLGWRSTRRGNRSQALPAKAKRLACTSGPWIELTVDCRNTSLLGAAQRAGRVPAPRGEWALVRVAALGRESHPLSVVMSADGTLSALVTARAGDWSGQLAALSDTEDGDGGSTCEVEIIGPFAAGGGDWSLSEEPALLLLAGGTGVFGWLPSMRDANECTCRQVHLVWCVKTEADYRALANMLPPKSAGVRVTIFVTGADVTGADVNTTPGAEDDVESGGRISEVSEPGHKPPSGAAGDGATGSSYQVVPPLPDRRLSRENQVVAPTQGSRLADVGDGGDDGSSLAWVWVSFLATAAGLTVGFWGWAYMKTELLAESDTLVGYTMFKRSLPIVLTLASVGVATILGSYFTKRSLRAGDWCAAAMASSKGALHHDHQEKVGLISNDSFAINDTDTNGQVAPKLMPRPPEADGTQAGEDDEPCAHHEVRAGRPNLAALVRSAAAEAATIVQQDGKVRLVVATCGPPGLVEATHTAVGSVRKEGSPVDLCHSGADSNW